VTLCKVPVWLTLHRLGLWPLHLFGLIFCYSVVHLIHDVEIIPGIHTRWRKIAFIAIFRKFNKLNMLCGLSSDIRIRLFTIKFIILLRGKYGWEMLLWIKVNCINHVNEEQIRPRQAILHLALSSWFHTKQTCIRLLGRRFTFAYGNEKSTGVRDIDHTGVKTRVSGYTLLHIKGLPVLYLYLHTVLFFVNFSLTCIWRRHNDDKWTPWRIGKQICLREGALFILC
jgi:hypothetical protein